MTINNVYPNTLAGYYSKEISQEGYAEQVNTMISAYESDNDYLACKDGVFYQISIYKRIALLFIRCIGFTDSADQTMLASQQLKFFYHGEANGLLKDDAVVKLKERLNKGSFTDPYVQKILQEIINRREARASDESLPTMRKILLDFHKENKQKLVPYFWSRMVGSHEMFESRMRDEFDDPHLELAQKTLREKNPEKALKELKFAAAKCGTPQIFEKIGVELKYLLAHYTDHPSLRTKANRPVVHDLFIKVAKSFSQNRLYSGSYRLEKCREYLEILSWFYNDEETQLKVKECYLVCGYYHEAASRLQALSDSRPQDPYLHLEIARAYLHLGDVGKSIEVFEIAINNFEAKREKSVLSRTHGEVGKICLTAPVPNAKEKAVHHLTKAWENYPTEVEYQNQLLQAYVQLKDSPEGFEARFGESFFNFFKSTRNGRNEVTTDIAGEVLLKCIQQLLNRSVDNQEKAMDYFRPFHLTNEFVLAICGIAMECNAETILVVLEETYIKTRERRSLVPDPELSEKLGTYYCAKDKNYAQQLLEKARQAFESKKQQTEDLELIENYDLHLANIHSKLAQNMLSSPSTIVNNGCKENEAIKHLKEALRGCPNNLEYRNQLFNALIRVAENEEKGLIPDTGKIIAYYRQAYECNSVKAPLEKLLVLFLDPNQTDPETLVKASDLFRGIQDKPWVEEIELSAYCWNRLGKAGHLPKNLALKCLQKACELEPEDELFREAYKVCNQSGP